MFKFNIYESTTTSFTNNGLGLLTDAEAAQTVNQINNEYKFTFVYPLSVPNIKQNGLADAKNSISKADLIQDQRIVVVEGQPFRINMIQKTFNKIQVQAMHIFYDLYNCPIVNEVQTAGLSPERTIVELINATRTYTSLSTRYNFDVSEISNLIQTTNNYSFTNLVDVIMNDQNGLLNDWGCEIERDGFLIKFVPKVGSNNNVSVEYRKNIEGFEYTSDTLDYFTHMIPVGFDGIPVSDTDPVIAGPVLENKPVPNYLNEKAYKVISFPDIKITPVEPNVQGVTLSNISGSLPLRNIQKLTMQFEVKCLDEAAIELFEYKIGGGDYNAFIPSYSSYNSATGYTTYTYSFQYGSLSELIKTTLSGTASLSGTLTVSGGGGGTVNLSGGTCRLTSSSNADSQRGEAVTLSVKITTEYGKSSEASSQFPKGLKSVFSLSDQIPGIYNCKLRDVYPQAGDSILYYRTEIYGILAAFAVAKGYVNVGNETLGPLYADSTSGFNPVTAFDSVYLNTVIQPGLQKVVFSGENLSGKSSGQASFTVYVEDPDNPVISYRRAQEILREKALEYFNVYRPHYPIVNFKVDFIDVSKTVQYKDLRVLNDCNIGDIVTVNIREYNIRYETRVLRKESDLINPTNNFIELAEVRPNLYNNIINNQLQTRAVYKAIQNNPNKLYNPSN